MDSVTLKSFDTKTLPIPPTVAYSCPHYPRTSIISIIRTITAVTPSDTSIGLTVSILVHVSLPLPLMLNVLPATLLLAVNRQANGPPKQWYSSPYLPGANCLSPTPDLQVPSSTFKTPFTLLDARLRNVPTFTKPGHTPVFFPLPAGVLLIRDHSPLVTC